MPWGPGSLGPLPVEGWGGRAGGREPEGVPVYPQNPPLAASQPGSSQLREYQELPRTLETQQAAIFPCFSNSYTLLNYLTVDWI